MSPSIPYKVRREGTADTESWYNRSDLEEVPAAAPAAAAAAAAAPAAAAPAAGGAAAVRVAAAAPSVRSLSVCFTSGPLAANAPLVLPLPAAGFSGALLLIGRAPVSATRVTAAMAPAAKELKTIENTVISSLHAVVCVRDGALVLVDTSLLGTTVKPDGAKLLQPEPRLAEADRVGEAAFSAFLLRRPSTPLRDAMRIALSTAECDVEFRFVGPAPPPAPAPAPPAAAAAAPAPAPAAARIAVGSRVKLAVGGVEKPALGKRADGRVGIVIVDDLATSIP